LKDKKRVITGLVSQKDKNRREERSEDQRKRRAED
jgi:hypothetical protein